MSTVHISPSRRAGGFRATGNEAVEPSCRISQVATADDVVSLKDRARLVAGELHGHPLGDAGAHEVPNGGSTTIADVLHEQERPTLRCW